MPSHKTWEGNPSESPTAMHNLVPMRDGVPTSSWSGADNFNMVPAYFPPEEMVAMEAERHVRAAEAARDAGAVIALELEVVGA